MLSLHPTQLDQLSILNGNGTNFEHQQSAQFSIFFIFSIFDFIFIGKIRIAWHLCETSSIQQKTSKLQSRKSPTLRTPEPLINQFENGLGNYLFSDATIRSNGKRFWLMLWHRWRFNTKWEVNKEKERWQISKSATAQCLQKSIMMRKLRLNVAEVGRGRQR